MPRKDTDPTVPAFNAENDFFDKGKVVTSGNATGNGTSSADAAAATTPAEKPAEIPADYVPPAPGEVSDVSRPITADGTGSAADPAPPPTIKTESGATVTTGGPGRYKVSLAAQTPLAHPEVETDAQDEESAWKVFCRANGIAGSSCRRFITRIGDATGEDAALAPTPVVEVKKKKPEFAGVY